MKQLAKMKESKSHILVIGDVMLDHYYRGNVKRISPESPVPVFNYKDSHYRLGGAANVAANLAAITRKVSLMAVIGDDVDGKKLKEILDDMNINHQFILADSGRSTTVKTRLLAQNNQQVIRIDREDDSDISIAMQDMLLEKLRLNINHFDLVLVSDYLKGLLTERFLQKVIGICDKNSKKVIIDIKGGSLKKYRKAYLLKPNDKELADILKCNLTTEIEVIEAAKSLKRQAETDAVLVTRGEKGMTLIDENDEVKHIFGTQKEVFDVTGAGDTVLAYLGCGIANQIPLYDSAEIANVAAGIKVGKVGSAVVRLDEVERFFNGNSPNISKIITLEEYLKIKHKYKNKTVVFTNGCFDILHVGHVRYLRKAAELGEVLIVGVNSDSSVRRLKGEERPIVCEKDRMEMLADLDFISHVIKFEEDTPIKLIEGIQPDLLVKGGDYKPEEVVGKEIVERNAGKVVLIPLVEGKSTTNIVEKILSFYQSKEEHKKVRYGEIN